MAEARTGVPDAAVIGAGMVGVCCALRLQQAGLDVVLIDRDAPGRGASSGNAGNFATWGVLPLNAPGLIWQVPGMLASATGPLAIKWRGVPALTPWLIRFLQSCAPDRVAASTAALAALLARSTDATMPLIEAAGARDLIFGDGVLNLYPAARHARAADAQNAVKRAHGINVRDLSRDDALALEPNLAPVFHSASLYEDGFSFRDPRALVERLAVLFVSSGGRVEQAAVTDVSRATPERMRVTTDGGVIEAGRVVVAAGAWSRRVPGAVPDRIPLDTERGYHVEFPGGGNLLTRSVGWAETGFYMTPMAGGLRVAGTVELGGLDAPPTRRRIDMLARGARHVLPMLGEPKGEWLGFRPSLPDALPVIGPSPSEPGIVYAFGHQHLGMTLAGITGEIVAALMTGRTPPVDVAPFRPDRF